MHRTLAVLILSALAASGADVVFPFQNVQNQGQAVHEVSLFPIAVPAAGASGLVVKDKVTKPTGLAGSVTFSNLLDGSYRVEFRGTSLTSTQYFYFPATNGMINATNYVVGTNPVPLTIQYAATSGSATNYTAQSNLVQTVIGQSNSFGGLSIYPFLGDYGFRIGHGTNWMLLNTRDLSYGSSFTVPGHLEADGITVHSGGSVVADSVVAPNVASPNAVTNIVSGMVGSGTMTFAGSANLTNLQVTGGPSTFISPVQMSNPSNTFAGNIIGGNGIILDQTFSGTSIPSNWIATYGWGVSNGPSGGVLYSTSSSPYLGSYAVWNQNSTLDKKYVYVIGQSLGGTGRWGPCFNDDIIGIVGSFVIVDSLNGLLWLAGSWATNTSYGAAPSLSVPWLQNNAHRIGVLLKKTDVDHSSVYVTDLESGSNATLAVTADYNVPNLYNGLGRPGVINYATTTDLLVHRVIFGTTAPKRPRLLCIGHSIDEGNSLSGQADLRWCARLRDYAGPDHVAIAGMGGESIHSLNTWKRLMVDLQWFNPEFVTINLGLNDPDCATW